MVIISAYIFAILVILAAAFQIALAAGMPWGEYAMAGKFPGKLPRSLRFAAIFQAVLLLCFGIVMLMRAQVMINLFGAFTVYAAWLITGFSGLSFILNLITPSRKERMIWAPVAFLLLVTSLVVVLS